MSKGASASPTGPAPSGLSRPAASQAKPLVPCADERLAELLALEENWNGYRGRPVDKAVAERVRAFFPLAAKLALSPWISPLSDGSLQIERAGTDDYTVEFNRDGTASLYLDGLSDRDALGLLSQFALLQALNRAASAGESGTATTPQSGVVHEHATADRRGRPDTVTKGKEEER